MGLFSSLVNELGRELGLLGKIGKVVGSTVLDMAENSENASQNLEELYLSAKKGSLLSRKRLYDLGAEQNDKEAQYYIGLLLWSEDKDLKGCEWMNKSAKQGYVPAQYRLGLNFIEDESQKVRDTGLAWLMAAAEAGHSMAQCRAGFETIQLMDTVHTDEEKAKLMFVGMSLIKMSAKQGNTDAQELFQKMLDHLEINAEEVPDSPFD